MKTLSFLALLFLTTTTLAQNILRVNNQAAANAPYTTIQDALGAAVNGDIILIEGSPVSYTNSGDQISVSKRVTIQGPGYFLNENTGLQLNQNPAYLNGGTLNLESGSEGSVIKGMQIPSVNINAGNITFSNNYCYSSLGVNASNFSASENYITGYISAGNGLTLNNVMLSNNLIASRINFNLNNITIVYAIIKGNVITSDRHDLNYATVIDNIFTVSYPPIESYFNAVIQNNVFVSPSQPGADATNGFSADPASLFIGVTGNTTDTQWKLKAGSPAIGAGIGGIDCGIYGGPTPYGISGIQLGQPTITGLLTPGTVQQSGTLNVKVSAKVN